MKQASAKIPRQRPFEVHGEEIGDWPNDMINEKELWLLCMAARKMGFLPVVQPESDRFKLYAVDPTEIPADLERQLIQSIKEE